MAANIEFSTRNRHSGGKNLDKWLRTITGTDARLMARALVEGQIYPSTQAIADEVGLAEKAAIAALWRLKELGRIDLVIDGAAFTCRRLFKGGRS